VIESEFMRAEDISTLCSFIKETVDEMEELNDPARAALKALQNVRSSIEIKASKDTRFGAILAQMPEFSK
jgi:hypothetical protein